MYSLQVRCHHEYHNNIISYNIMNRSIQQMVTVANSLENKCIYKYDSRCTCQKSTNRRQTTLCNVVRSSNSGDVVIHTKKTV